MVNFKQMTTYMMEGALTDRPYYHFHLVFFLRGPVVHKGPSGTIFFVLHFDSVIVKRMGKCKNGIERDIRVKNKAYQKIYRFNSEILHPAIV